MRGSPETLYGVSRQERGENGVKMGAKIWPIAGTRAGHGEGGRFFLNSLFPVVFSYPHHDLRFGHLDFITKTGIFEVFPVGQLGTETLRREIPRFSCFLPETDGILIVSDCILPISMNFDGFNHRMVEI